MVELKIPFLGSDNRELAELGRDTLSGSDWFWLQFFLIGIGGGVLPLAMDYYLHYRVLGIDGLYWFAGAWFLAGIWAGGNKFWDDQKRNSPRWSSPGFEGTVRLNKGTVLIEEATDGKANRLFPPLRAVPEGVDHLIHWTPARGVKVIERDDAVFAPNGRHYVSGTESRQRLWDELPAHVQDALRTQRRMLKIKFVRGDWRVGRPVLGTKFVYGDEPMFETMFDHRFAKDISSEAVLASERMARSGAERMGVYALGTGQTIVKSISQHVTKKAKAVNPLDEESEAEERESFQ